LKICCRNGYRFSVSRYYNLTESNSRKKRVEGRFELDLAFAWRLLGKMMVSQDATIFCFWWESAGAIFWKDISSRAPLPDLIGFHQYPGMR
jgi:hypothetical protein